MDISNVPPLSVGLQFLSITLLGVVSYFLKRAINDLDHLTDKVGELQVKVAILLDRDRRQRVEDYNRETWPGGSD